MILTSQAAQLPHTTVHTHVLPSRSTANMLAAASDSSCAHSRCPCLAATSSGVRLYRSRAFTVLRSRLNEGKCSSGCCCCCCCVGFALPWPELNAC